MKFYLFCICLFCITLYSCSKKNDTVSGGSQPPPPAADTILYKMMPFPVGAAVSVNLMKTNLKYSGVVSKEYNSITAENAMKFDAVHPAENTFSWTDADYLVNYAQANNKRIHGHTLNWYNALPNWVKSFAGDSTAWENLLKTHIQTVVAHFKGKVTSWDVVNEAFNDDGTIRNTIWVQKLGPDYIARCFQYARQADPEALLCYNDYGNEYSSAKRNAISNLVASFKARGIPIDCLGMQFHMTYTQSDANIAAAMNSAAATGLKVHISELDIRLNDARVQGLMLTPALSAQQAAKYKSVVKAYNAIPASQQFGITTWNVGDADSWIPAWQGAPDYPLPFDRNYARKDAYRGIIEGVK